MTIRPDDVRSAREWLDDMYPRFYGVPSGTPDLSVATNGALNLLSGLVEDLSDGEWKRPEPEYLAAVWDREDS